MYLNFVRHKNLSKCAQKLLCLHEIREALYLTVPMFNSLLHESYFHLLRRSKGVIPPPPPSLFCSHVGREILALRVIIEFFMYSCLPLFEHSTFFLPPEEMNDSATPSENHVITCLFSCAFLMCESK
jgi:hypothetical protein